MLSIIVPVLNEAGGIATALARLAPARARGAQVIVIDGGSVDGTPEIARTLVDQVIVSAPGRAVQMNAGAALASGQVLLFLHADTFLPDGADALIEAALQSGRVWGRFDVRIEGRHWMLGVVARMMNLRSRLSGVATGDQALFMRADVFRAIGGFPEQALMEDIAMSEKLRLISPPACIDQPVHTSGRRWERHGLWRTVALMWWLRLRYFLGADPDRLAHLYRREPD